ncbi:hypothetical protein NTGBS_510024 [Candidatus Nitrotoga sp. BS]|nr:hypothetical protein NTGBS_510024 [Candidatus Nitrotoga sp. BS]
MRPDTLVIEAVYLVLTGDLAKTGFERMLRGAAMLNSNEISVGNFLCQLLQLFFKKVICKFILK